MEDAQIIDLYWQRNEDAIQETDRKYGNYCNRVAYNILGDHEDGKEDYWKLSPSIFTFAYYDNR